MFTMKAGSEKNEQGILWFKSGNFDKAKECWEESAKLGNASSMFCMGILYLSSNYLNLEVAKKWFEKAYLAGHKNAKYQLDCLMNKDIKTDKADRLFGKPQNVYQNEFKIRKFGAYDWFVIGEEPGKELLLSKDIIGILKFHHVDGPISWAESDIRFWLNSEFYNEFSASERGLICTTCNENNCNPEYFTESGEKTWDKCFLLSYDELMKYMLKNRVVINTLDLISEESNQELLVSLANISDKMLRLAENISGLDYSMVNGQNIGWWLRTAGESSNKAIRVNCNGAVRLYGREVDRNLVGVRPAIWVKKNE